MHEVGLRSLCNAPTGEEDFSVLSKTVFDDVPEDRQAYFDSQQKTMVYVFFSLTYFFPPQGNDEQVILHDVERWVDKQTNWQIFFF